MTDNSNQNLQIDWLLEKLYSPSEPERELAKRQLIELGADAVIPLIAFLRDLAASNSIPRFQTGQEQQGQAAYENFCLLVQREGYDSPNVDAATERVFNLTINDRLSSDVIVILGEIKSEEAIQFLIKIMEDNGRNPGFGEEISALQAIGLDAVPYLINEIREIDRKVRTDSIEGLQPHFGLICNLPEEPADIPEEELNQFVADAKPDHLESFIQWHVHRIQEIILRIFRRMKDPRTLPYLEELLKETTDKRLISKIKETIAYIKAPPVVLTSRSGNVSIILSDNW